MVVEGVILKVFFRVPCRLQIARNCSFIGLESALIILRLFVVVHNHQIMIPVKRTEIT